MRKMGLEPTQLESYKILSLARLPVPTLPHLSICRSQLSFQQLTKKNITINQQKSQQLFLVFRYPVIRTLLFTPTPAIRFFIQSAENEKNFIHSALVFWEAKC